MLPHDLPPWGTVHYYYRRFRRNGTLLNVHERLLAHCNHQFFSHFRLIGRSVAQSG